MSRVNTFALLESDDPGDTRLVDLTAQAKADTAAKKERSRKFHRRREPEMSPWKKKKLQAEAEAAAKMKVQQQLAALYTKTNVAGRSRRQLQPAMPFKAPIVVTARIGKNIQGACEKPTTPPAVPSRAPVSSAAAVDMKPKPPAAVSTACASTSANTGDNEQFQQEPPAPARGNLFDQLFAYANSVRAFIYGSRKPVDSGTCT